MPRVHDRGGWPAAGPINVSDHELSVWEKNLMGLLGGCSALYKGDEFRRAIEDIEPNKYETLGYFERWVVALETLLIQKGVLTLEEIDQKMAALDTQTD